MLARKWLEGFVFERLVSMDADAQPPWMDLRRLLTNKTSRPL